MSLIFLFFNGVEIIRVNIDDRLDRLTERHEALTQSLELLVAHVREEDDKLREEIRVVNEQVKAVNVAASLLVEVARSRQARIERLEPQ
jgi:hypothetical protein